MAEYVDGFIQFCIFGLNGVFCFDEFVVMILYCFISAVRCLLIAQALQIDSPSVLCFSFY